VADETEFNIYNTDRKLAAIEDAAKKLSALPEKKALIYFAGGVARTGVDNQAHSRPPSTRQQKPMWRFIQLMRGD